MLQCRVSFLVLISIALLGGNVAAGEQLRRGNFIEPESLDPHVSRGVEAANILRDMYEGLTREGPAGEILPGTAESWTRSKDGLRWTFSLRPDARWSNGDPLLAQDFVYGLQRALAPDTASPFASSLAVIRNAAAVSAGKLPVSSLGVTASGEHRLVIELESPTPYLLGLLAHHSAYPVHAASIEEHGKAFTRPGKHVSNGAYHLVEWQVNDRIVLERNPQYWDRDAVSIDSVAYLPIDDEEAEFMRFRAGELDITQGIPVRRYQWLRQNMPESLRVTPYLSTYFYGFNLQRPPFKDAPGLRRALSLVIDRDILAREVLGAGELPAWSLTPPGIKDYDAPQPPHAAWTMQQRIAEARALYAAAGYTDEQPLQVELRYNTGDNHRRVALAVSSMWRRHLGVETRLVNEEWKVFIQNRRQGVLTQVFRSAWVGDYNDPLTFLQLLQAEHPLNDYGYRSDEYDSLLARASVTGDASARRALLREAEQLMLSDQAVLPLYYYVSKHLVQPRVKNWQDNIMDHHATRNLQLAE